MLPHPTLDVEAGGPHSGPHAFAASTANREAIPLALFADFFKKINESIFAIAFVKRHVRNHTEV